MKKEEDDLTIINEKEKKYINEIQDFEQYWYLGERFQFNEFAGYTNAPFNSNTLNISKKGFRGKEVTFKNINNTKRIGFFGPSGLIGIPVNNDDQTITSFSNQFFKNEDDKFEAIDFGVISSRIGIETRLITKILIEYDLDIVILLSGYNDFSSYVLGSLWDYQDVKDIYEDGFILNKNSANFKYFIKRIFKSILRKNEIKKANKLSKKNFRGAEKYFRAKRSQKIYYLTLPDVIKEGTELYLSCLMQIASLCNYKKKEFIFIPQPNLFTSKKKFSRYELASFRKQNNIFGADENLQKSRIEKFQKSYDNFILKCMEHDKDKKFTILDVDREINKQTENQDIFYDESHYFENGNKIIGETISKYIIKEFS